MAKVLIDDFDKNRVIKNFESFLLVENDQYVDIYKTFIDFFDAKETLTVDDVLIGASFTYSWMPTILNFKVDDFFASAIKNTEILNELKKVDSISDLSIRHFEMIEEIMPFINNSLVGTSKLLHFINPEVFPIWDSRVYLFLRDGQGKANQQHLKSIKYYQSYINLCTKILSDEKFEGFYKRYEQKIGYKVSAVRALEHLMFTMSKNKKED